MVQRAHKIRLKPTKAQELLLSKTVGARRFVYNWGIDKWAELYRAGQRTGANVLSKIWTVERPAWSREVDAHALQHALKDVEYAFRMFFSHHAKYPGYQKKRRRDSAYFDNLGTRICGKRIRFSKIGWVKLAEPLRFDAARVLFYTLTREANQWYVSIQCEIPEDRRSESTSVVGVDVGIKHWAVASDGSVLDEPKKLKHLRREVKRKQRLADRKKKGSANKRKAYLKVSKLYQRIDNIKKDAIHKFTSTISKNHGVVVIEDLCVEGMRKGVKSIRKGVNDACMGEIHRQLMYKCNNYIRVDRFFPSSKTCSHCGCVNDALTLSDRSYHCPSCGHTIDRDLNASINLLNEGLRKLSTVGHTVKDCGDLLRVR